MAQDPINDRPEPGPNDVRLRPETVKPVAAPVDVPEFIESMPVLRQMFLDRRFGLVMLVLFGGVLAGVGGMIRVWPATPAHIQPTRRHSLLDRVQAWSLARTAERHLSAKNAEAAFINWRLAIVNHPGDPVLYRGLMRTVAVSTKLQREQLAAFHASAAFLIQLSKTNVADLALVGEAYRQQGYADEAVSSLLGHRDELPPNGLVTLLKALYDTGQITAMGSIWPRLTPDTYAQGDLALYHDGWVVAAGALGEIPAALARLRAAETNPATASLAAHLNLGLADHRDDPDGCRRSLDRLIAEQKDNFADHIRYWRLLARSGRLEEARKLARAGNRVPQEPYPFSELVRVLMELGLVEDADALLEQQLKGTGPLARVPRLWALRARLLESLKRWDDLKIQALELRSNRHVSQTLAGFGWYLEGIADHQLGRGAGSGMAFDRMLNLGISDPTLNFEAATRLRSLGYGDTAGKLLAQLAQRLGDSPDYWFQVQLAAYDNRDLGAFRDAAERAHRLRPNNAIYANNLAAALLIQRVEPARALSLTADIRKQNPTNPRLILNHCLAMVQNQQFDEARRILGELDLERLPRAERTTYHEVAFELASHDGNAGEMQRHFRQIEQAHLFPLQIQWLEAALAKLPSSGQNPTNPTPFKLAP